MNRVQKQHLTSDIVFKLFPSYAPNPRASRKAIFRDYMAAIRHNQEEQ